MPLRHERTPLRIAAAASLGTAFLALPLLAVFVRAPWASLGSTLGDATMRQTIMLSLGTSLSSALVSLAIGMPLAAVLAHSAAPWTRLLRMLTTMPIVLPPVVAGVALLLAFGRNGLVGQWLWRWFGWQIPFTAVAVVMAQTFVAMPFLVLTLEAALRHADADLSDAAASAGATRWQALRLVTLPSIGPSVVAAVALAWARAFGEFGATITFAGNFPGRTQTLPIAVYLALESNPTAAIAVSLVMMGVSAAVLVALRGHWLGST